MEVGRRSLDRLRRLVPRHRAAPKVRLVRHVAGQRRMMAEHHVLDHRLPGPHRLEEIPQMHPGTIKVGCGECGGFGERQALAEASARSGYSQDHLARLIREGSLPQGRRRGGRLEGHRDVAHLLSATGCRYVVGSDERAEEDARCRARIRLMRPPRPPDPGQVVGKTAPQTAPPLIEAQSTAGAIANGASCSLSRDGGI